MPTGDVRNNLRKLQSELRAVRYVKELNHTDLAHGQVEDLLAIYHYVFVDYSRPVAEQVAGLHVELNGKQDDRFIEGVYRVLRDLFSYKPPVTKDRFFSTGFGEQKIIMATDVVRLVRDRHHALCPKTVRAGSGGKHTPTKGCRVDTGGVQVVKETSPSPTQSSTSSNSYRPAHQATSAPFQATKYTPPSNATTYLSAHKSTAAKAHNVPYQSTILQRPFHRSPVSDRPPESPTERKEENNNLVMSQLTDIQEKLTSLQMRMTKVEDRMCNVEGSLATMKAPPPAEPVASNSFHGDGDGEEQQAIDPSES